MLQSYIDGAAAGDGSVKQVAHIAVEAIEDGSPRVVVLVYDVAGMAVVIVPDGDKETYLGVLALESLVEIQVECSDCIGGVEHEAAGYFDVGSGGGDAIAVFGDAVVIGIVVAEDLCPHDGVVLWVAVAAHTFADAVYHGVGGGHVVVCHGQGVSESGLGMCRCGLVGMAAPVDGGILKTSVIVVQFPALVVEYGVAVVRCQLLGEAVGDGEGERVAQVAGGELPCRHGRIMLQQRRRRIDKGHVARGRVFAVSAGIETYIVDVPLVGIAQHALFIVVLETAKVVEAELEVGFEVVGIEDGDVVELPVGPGAVVKGVGLAAFGGPHPFPDAVDRVVEFEDEGVLLLGGVAYAFPHVAITASGQIEEAEVERVANGKGSLVGLKDGVESDGAGEECVASE